MPPHFKRNHRDEAFFTVDPCPGHGKPFHGKGCAIDPWCQRLEILQSVKLTWPESARGAGGVNNDFNNGWRQADDLVHGWPQAAVKVVTKGIKAARCRCTSRQCARNQRIALLRTAHCTDHITLEARMEIAKETDIASIVVERHEDLRPLRFRKRFGRAA